MIIVDVHYAGKAPNVAIKYGTRGLSQTPSTTALTTVNTTAINEEERDEGNDMYVYM